MLDAGFLFLVGIAIPVSSTQHLNFVRMEGLEPPRLSAPDPKSGTATNYATCAKTFSHAYLPKLRDTPHALKKPFSLKGAQI